MAIFTVLLIFILRVLDIAAATLRMLMVIRGRKLNAWILGFIQAMLFVLAIQAVLSDLGSWINIIAYATGFATGTVIGMLIEERIAIGFKHLRIISSRRGTELAEYLRTQGYAVTEVAGRGKDGTVSLLNCTVQRKDLHQIEMLVKEKDEQAFITADDVIPVSRGFWKR
ncbi:MAG: DUF5698 domain-containing protein [Anaerolineales bacterium]|jgi:uncharacterized protein YebE (UPF0316 family)